MSGLSEVLAAHAGWLSEIDESRTDEDAVFWRFRCKCGELLPRGGFADPKHREHVAEHVERIIAAREVEAGQQALRDAAGVYAAIGIRYDGRCQCEAEDDHRPCYCDTEEFLNDRADRMGLTDKQPPDSL